MAALRARQAARTFARKSATSERRRPLASASDLADCRTWVEAAPVSWLLQGGYQDLDGDHDDRRDQGEADRAEQEAKEDRNHRRPL